MTITIPCDQELGQPKFSNRDQLAGVTKSIITQKNYKEMTYNVELTISIGDTGHAVYN